jgi:hypothetical protein
MYQGTTLVVPAAGFNPPSPGQSLWAKASAMGFFQEAEYEESV